MAESTAEKMVIRLRDMQAASSDIIASAVVSVDGLTMASALPGDVEEDRVSAMSAAMLSLGERMKLELMASLLHTPEIIFLDEPTIGLDLVAQENIREFIKNYHRDHNVTIILTSHYMADVHALCKRLVLIMDGKKCFDGSLSKFETILHSLQDRRNRR